jgi:hypothetical protein
MLYRWFDTIPVKHSKVDRLCFFVEFLRSLEWATLFRACIETALIVFQTVQTLERYSIQIRFMSGFVFVRGIQFKFKFDSRSEFCSGEEFNSSSDSIQDRGYLLERHSIQIQIRFKIQVLFLSDIQFKLKFDSRSKFCSWVTFNLNSNSIQDWCYVLEKQSNQIQIRFKIRVVFFRGIQFGFKWISEMKVSTFHSQNAVIFERKMSDRIIKTDSIYIWMHWNKYLKEKLSKNDDRIKLSEKAKLNWFLLFSIFFERGSEL